MLAMSVDKIHVAPLSHASVTWSFFYRKKNKKKKTLHEESGKTFSILLTVNDGALASTKQNSPLAVRALKNIFGLILHRDAEFIQIFTPVLYSM